MAVLTPNRTPGPEAVPEVPLTRTGRGSSTVLLWVVVLSAAAGAIHFANAPAHFREADTHGAFFVTVGVFQVAWAIAALRHPSRRVLLLAGLNVVVIAVWLVSRTAGLPITGDGSSEPVEFPDVAATLFEVAIIGGAAFLLARRSSVDLVPRPSVVGGLVAAGVVVTAALAMTPEYGGTEHVHAGAASGADATATGGIVLTGDTPCEKSGPPASPAQVTDAEGHSHRGPMPQQQIGPATRDALAAQQVLARSVADKYPTVAAAEAAGYKMSTRYVPCIGAHYTNVGLVATFDPTVPSELLFDGTNPDSKLVGLSYLVYHPGGAPEGFAGPNDIWHQHNANGGLCFNPVGVVIGSEDMTERECTRLGGRKAILKDIWMLHDWIVPGWECSWGVFAPECPELGGRVGGTAWDPPAPNQAAGNISG